MTTYFFFVCLHTIVWHFGTPTFEIHNHNNHTIRRHLPPDHSHRSCSTSNISVGLKLHNTRLVLISAICTVINPCAITCVPSKQASRGRYYILYNSSLQAYVTPGPKSNFAPGFFWGPTSVRAGS